MEKRRPISDFRIATDSGSVGTCVAQQAFADASTWDEIISILEEEALRKFAVAGQRVSSKSSFVKKADMQEGGEENV